MICLEFLSLSISLKSSRNVSIFSPLLSCTNKTYTVEGNCRDHSSVELSVRRDDRKKWDFDDQSFPV